MTSNMQTTTTVTIDAQGNAVEEDTQKKALFDIYHQALYLQRIGEVNEAKALYEKIQRQIEPNTKDKLSSENTLEKVREVTDQARRLAKGAKREQKKKTAKKTEDLHKKAVVYFDNKQFDQAITLFETILELDSHHVATLANLGAIYFQKKNYYKAISYLQHSLFLEPCQSVALNTLGLVFSELDLLDQAIEVFDKALSIAPHDANIYLHKGGSYHKFHRYEESIQNYTKAIELDPNLLEAFSNRGNVFIKLKSYESALSDFEKLASADLAHSYSRIGVALEGLGRHEEAIKYFDELLNKEEATGNSGSMLYLCKGSALQSAGRFTEAYEAIEQAILLDPKNAYAYWNLSTLLLLLGQYQLGWELYEWRWKVPELQKWERPADKQLWLGDEDLTGKKLLITMEQGYGDMIQFCRYAVLLAAVGIEVHLEVPRPLLGVIKSLSPEVHYPEQGTPVLDYDYYCPLMTLPHVFKTEVTTIPSLDQYLYVDPHKQAGWRRRLGPTNTLRIGVVWAGNPNHKNDENRSISFNEIRPLFSLDAEIHVLQKEINAKDISELKQYSNAFLWHNYLRDFSDTAALINEMDLVISVDTSIAHLAGAIGKPVWILLPFVSDYRWLLDREDTPWYPSARLFRQEQPKVWKNVIANVKNNLTLIINSAPQPSELIIEEKDQTNENIANVIYIHSPVTYTIADNLVKNETLQDPVVICGRKMDWLGLAMNVIDDGVWNIKRTVDFLKKICDALDLNSANKFNIFLPHTGFLLGTLLKSASAIQSIFYIEEGDASYRAEILNGVFKIPTIDTVELITTLKDTGVANRLGIDIDAIQKINQDSAIWFDDKHQKYGGAFSIGQDAFSGMANVKRITLGQPIPHLHSHEAWLCMLPCISNNIAEIKNNTPSFQQFSSALTLALKEHKAQAKTARATLLIKLHPMDEMYLSSNSKREIYDYGEPYSDFCKRQGLDHCLEPSLYNFDRFIIINSSSATRYIKQFHADTKLIEIAL